MPPPEFYLLYGCGIGGMAVALLGIALGTRGYRNLEGVSSCLTMTLYVIIAPGAVGVALLCCGSIQGALACFVTVIFTGVMWLAGALVYLWVVV